MYSAAVKDLVLCHLGAMKIPVTRPATDMAHCIVMATQPEEYAIEPQTTKVLADTKPINRERLLIHQGTAPPAAKNESMSPPDFLEKERPMNMISNEKSPITK